LVTEARIKEIFTSIQGEGSIVGCKQLFIRFCGCNLSCNYCDTDFGMDDSILYSPYGLADKISQDYDLYSIHSISLTGGEPLLYADFINEFIPLVKNSCDIKIYLETNATLYDELLLIKDKIDIISADIKLPSSAGKDTFYLHSEFLKNCFGVKTFAKIVFDNNIIEHEIDECVKLADDNDIPLILQPKMEGDKMSVDSDFCIGLLDKFLQKYPKVRLIPQTHKFLNVQ